MNGCDYRKVRPNCTVADHASHIFLYFSSISLLIWDAFFLVLFFFLVLSRLSTSKSLLRFLGSQLQHREQKLRQLM